MLKPSKAFPTTHEQMWNSALGWRMINPKMPGEWTISLGEGAEVLADKYSISRDEQDAFAMGSHQRAAAAWAAGHFAAEIVQVAGRADGARRVHPARFDDGVARQAEAGVPPGWHR